MSTIDEIHRIEVPVPYLGSMNLWLLPGDPLTLVDTGPNRRDAHEALETGLAVHGIAVEDIELLLLTHHHLDHTGLAAMIRERSGARIAATAAVAAWGRDYTSRIRRERAFTEQLLRDHGVPDRVAEAMEPFFEHIVRESHPFDTDRELAADDVVGAGGRRLRVVTRPGHSTTDTLFVDETTGEAFVGDHLLAEITSGAELTPLEPPAEGRRRALVDFLDALRATERMELTTCYTGHGPTVADHRGLIAARFAFHEARLTAIADQVAGGCRTAFEIARRVWSDEVAEDQAVLAIWEVVGHLDVLVDRGVVASSVTDTGALHYDTMTAPVR